MIFASISSITCILCIFSEIVLWWMPIILSQHNFREWFCAVRQQAIILTIVDQYLSQYGIVKEQQVEYISFHLVLQKALNSLVPGKVIVIL